MINVWTSHLLKVIDILIVAYVFYRLILLVKGTRSVQILTGIVIIAILTFIVREILPLKTLNWLLKNLWFYSVIIIAIVFQPEFRQLLAQLGSEPIKRIFIPVELKFINEIMSAIKEMSQNRTGGLIVLQQETGLRDFIETGCIINGQLSMELLLSIFYTKSILHDGAVIMQESRLIAAGCILPVSDNPYLSKALGTRHRAGLGISEVSDAIAIIVSEETGQISMARHGKLERDMEPDNIEASLERIYKEKFEKSFIHKNTDHRIKNA
ncbi:MAG: diadenylate cyclase CdaA [Elusimicrobia bacterium]|nr:diadenylate cyclase CdaA [Elusimicrobiota bacterium]